TPILGRMFSRAALNDLASRTIALSAGGPGMGCVTAGWAALVGPLAAGVVALGICFGAGVAGLGFSFGGGTVISGRGGWSSAAVRTAWGVSAVRGRDRDHTRG